MHIAVLYICYTVFSKLAMRVHNASTVSLIGKTPTPFEKYSNAMQYPKLKSVWPKVAKSIFLTIKK